MSRAGLSKVVSGFRRARVLVIGDVMLDRFIWGDVRRISPEAPVPVVQVTRESEHPGGAGNVVANLAALGARPVLVGWVGDDRAGRRIEALLTGLGADATGIVRAREAESIEKTRIIAHSQQVVRLDRESSRPGPALVRRLADAVTRRLADADVVLVSDYGKGTIQPALLDLLAESRTRHRFTYLIDPKQPNFPHYRGATLVKPNESEAAAAAGTEIHDDADLARAGELLIERWSCEAVLISRGEHGMSLCRRGQKPRHFPTAAREVFDVTGAGDTALAAAALTLAGKGSLDDAALLANLAAGVVVGKVGTATLTRAELVQALSSQARKHA